ncbi:MAG TPA: type II toxin-antitoxin system death-on-curing family toxin [Planctomycetota bacterium]
MKAPVWLAKETVLAVHTASLQAHGGSQRVRDMGLLESALARPQHLFAYEKADLCRLAAAYGHGIAKNHPFVDGNKRAAFLAATVFLECNGLEFLAAPAHAAVFMLGVADGTLGEEAFVAWLRDNSRARRKGSKRTSSRRGQRSRRRAQ